MRARREAERGVFGEQPLVGREPAEAQVLVRVIERQLELAPAAPFTALLSLGGEPQSHLPEQLAAREAEAVAPAHPDEGLDRRALQARRSAPHKIPHTAERTALLALENGGGRGLLAPMPPEAEANPQGAGLDGTPHVAGVHVGRADLDVVALRVPAQDVE